MTSKSSTIKAVLFDVGGTLIDPFPSVGGVYAAVAETYGINIDAGELDRRFESAWKSKAIHSAAINKPWWIDLLGQIFADISVVNRGQFYDDLYDAFLEPKAWRVYDDVVPTLSELKRRQLSLAIASNWDERLPAILSGLQLSQFFDFQFVSYALGRSKPDPQFFQEALAQMKMAAFEVLHVGNDELFDGHGARSVGLKVALIDRKQSDPSGEWINTLKQVVPLVCQN